MHDRDTNQEPGSLTPCEVGNFDREDQAAAEARADFIRERAEVLFAPHRRAAQAAALRPRVRTAFATIAAVVVAVAAEAQSPARAARTSEWVVTNSAGGSTFTSFGARSAIELQNLGANPIYCTTDGTAPVVGKGRKIDATSPPSAWSFSAGQGITIRCISSLAPQVTGGATMVTELR